MTTSVRRGSKLPPMKDLGREPRRIVGAMTGTSIDGIDLALVEVHGRGLDMRCRLLATLSRPLGGLEQPLRALAQQKPATAAQIARIATEFGELHARAIRELLSAARSHADLVCAHGQTLFHDPPISLQLLNPCPIAERLRVPVVYDLRQADLAASGQGAPITPIADWVLFRDHEESRAVVNLGGFCNLTLLPAPRDHADNASWVGAVSGFDVCACNQALDLAARLGLGRAYDEDGAAASRAEPDASAVRELRALLDHQRAAGRSLGTRDDVSAWAERWATRIAGPSLARSACEAVGGAIAQAVRDSAVHAAFLAGGGTRNTTLVNTIARALSADIDVALTDEAGVPPAYREAVCMAVLGALCQDRVPITLPAVTGRRAGEVLSGAWVEAPL